MVISEQNCRRIFRCVPINDTSDSKLPGSGKDEKISELNRRELTHEETEMVVGGVFTYNGDGTVTVDGKTLSCDQFHTKFIAMAERYGFATAVSKLSGATGYKCPEMADDYNWGGSKSDRTKMETVMKRFWLNCSK